MDKTEKFKGERTINKIVEMVNNKHLLSVTLPLYIYYIDKEKSHTICDSKTNIDFEILFIKTNAEFIYKKNPRI